MYIQMHMDAFIYIYTCMYIPQDHDTQRMRERKELLEKKRLELVARVGSQRMLIPAMDSREVHVPL